MANNIDVRQAGGSVVTLKTTDSGGVHTPHHKVDSLPADPFGANADAAVVTDASGTMSGKLRGLVKWAFERMPASLGQKTAANSLPVQLSSDNPLPTKVSTDNSTTSVLGAGASFTGTGEDVSRFRSIVVNVYASHAGTLKVQFSSDGTNWDIEQSRPVAAASGASFVFAVQAQDFRVVYTNGGTLQTAFRLQAIIHPTVIPPTPAPVKSATGTISATTTIVAAVAGKKIKVLAYSLITQSTTAVTCTFKDGAGGTAKWTVPLQAPNGTIGGANLPAGYNPLFETSAGNALELHLSAEQPVTYAVSYTDDDAR